MHFGRRPRVYSYFKNISGLSFCYYFNVTSDEVTAACWVPKQKETFLENRVFFLKGMWNFYGRLHSSQLPGHY